MKGWHITALLRGILFSLGAKSLVWAFVFALACLVHEIMYDYIKGDQRE